MRHNKINKPYKILSFKLCLLLLALFSTNSAFSASQFKILILHSYSQEYPWTKSQHNGFIETYNANTKLPAIISTEHLDTKRTTYTPEYAQTFLNYLNHKYSDYIPDLIYVTDDNATQFALNNLFTLFPSTPIIFSGVNNFSIMQQIDKNKVTGVFEKKEILPNLQLLKLIDTNINSIIVLGDNSNTDRAIKLELAEQLTHHPEIQANYIHNNQIDQVASTLSKLTEKYLFLTTIGGMIDENGQHQSLKQSLNKISSAGNFIVISMEDSYLLKGVLGGYVTSGKQHGYSAAKMALEYQHGKPITDIPFLQTSPNEYIFDYNELKKNNIKLPGTLLTHASIINKPPSFYERNRYIVIIIIIALTSLVIILMAVFIIFISMKNKQINKTSRKAEQQSIKLQQIKEALTTAQELAHLGNWEWNPKRNKIVWSDEVYRILGETPHSIQASFEAIINHIPANERDNIKADINNSFNLVKPYEIEHQIIRSDGAVRYVRQVGDIHKDPEDQSHFLVGTILDITQIKQNELSELERLAGIERYQDALLEWSRVDYENIDQAFNRATEISANTLDIARVSIWLYNDDFSSIQCHNLYSKNKGHEKGFELFKTDFPNYFKAMQSGKMIVVNHARKDERTNEFTESYLIPNNIYSMLDAPIHYAGEVIGVVCHEFTNSVHEWSSQEQEFASAIASTVSLSLEIQKRREMEQELEHQAYHDALTKLPNRSLFIDRLDQALKLAQRSNTMLAVLFLDLDNFKEINDSLGHAAGDQVLIKIAQRLNANLREMDTISRLGGDEFTLIVSDFKDAQFIHEVVLKLFNILQQPMIINDQELYATSSIGISIYPDDGKTSETLIRNADAAMYKAKESGRNSFEFYTHDMTERAFERVLMETNLRRAIEQEEFIIYYQPQYDASTQTMTGIEALLRWQHPEMGMISPGKFIPVAENTGLIVELDRWVMKTATQQLYQWHQQGLHPGKLSLNMATKQLEQKDLLEFIKTTLEQSRCKPEWISFEITESQIMKDPEKAVSLLLEISALGIEIAVDDFGTGYSSLTYLKRLPVDKLKIDRAFINELPHDDEDIAIVRAIIALSESLRLGVIAEGAENQQQVDFLISEGCTEIQGFFFARPMPAEKIEALLNQ